MKSYRFLIIFFLSCSDGIFAQNLIRTKSTGSESPINCLAISQDGNVLLTGGADGKSYLWSTRTLEKAKGALKHNDAVLSIGIQGGGKYYVTGCKDNKIRIFDILQNSPSKVCSEHSAPVNGIALHPFEDILASVSADNTLKIWNLANTKTSIATHTFNQSFSRILFAPDAGFLFALSTEGSIQKISPITAEPLAEFANTKKNTTAFEISSDGKYLACGLDNGSVNVYSCADGKRLFSPDLLSGSIFALAFSRDARYLAAAGESDQIILMDLQSGSIVLKIPAGEKNITGIAISPDGKTLYTASAQAVLKAWDISSMHMGVPRCPSVTGNTTLSLGKLQIKEDNNNGLLDPGEKASLVFDITNTGTQPAYLLSAEILIDGIEKGLQAEPKIALGNLSPGKSLQAIVPLQVSQEIGSSNAKISITLAECNGAGGKAQTTVQTAGANAYSYVMITGQSYASATGKAAIGAPITVKVNVKNIAKTDARNIKVQFMLPENVKAVDKISELLPLLTPGESKEVSMDFYVEKGFTQSDVKMGVDIEGAAFTNARDILLKVKMNDPLPLTQDYSSEVNASAQLLASENNSQNEDHPLYRGSVDPLKGLNVNKPKEMVIGNYYGLIIGIDKYAGQWTPLNNAVNDASAVEKMLKASYKFENIKALYNTSATRDNIIKEFEWLIANTKENDNVFIFYSGHGEYKKELSRGFWVPVDANTPSTSKYISNSDIQTYINGIRAKHTLLVTDACFSGDIFRGNTVSVPFEESEKYYREVNSLPSRQALTSGGIEPVMDGGKEGHSVFTYYFLKSLESNKSKYFDASQLYTKVKIPVINNSEQTPKLSPIKNTGDEGGQFIFIKK